MSSTSSPADDLAKQYDHAAAQERWYKFWEDRGYFSSEPDPDRKRYPKGPFTIVIPPPNVTGALHLGHALNDTLQDIIIRFKRMQGYNTLWMPGTDHAGIATQAVVERRLKEEEGLDRHTLGREGLVKRIWEWKDKYEVRILQQFRQMGFSCDWRRTRFTLDEICARAVRHTFFRMFKDGLIFRGKRLVNWDTYLQTAVSDDEVYHDTTKGHFWHIRYPVIDPKPGEPEFVTIATTRPETMLGDTAVAVHPDPAAALDKAERELREKLAEAPAKEKATIEAELESLSHRRQTVLPDLLKLRDMALAGRKLRLPLAEREIPLIVDSWAKPELGSGCVKITPAHDENDYQVWQRHKEIGAINIMNPDGTTNDNVPEKYRGLKMHTKAREAVIQDLIALGLHNPETDREDREIDLAHSDRSKTPIEPYLADQWFVKMGDKPREGDIREGEAPAEPGLAQKCMDAVTSGRVKITPARYAKSYLDWLGEKRDWCIGRQLWWGHRVPVWSLKLNEDHFRKFPARMLGPGHTDEGIAAAEVRKVLGKLSLDAYDELTIGTDSLARQLRICTRSEDADRALSAIEKEIEYRKRDQPLKSKFGLAAEYFDSVEQDPDVLDTWFSSALWPMSTLGWPGPALTDKPKGPSNPEWNEQKYYYPTSVLITSREIITLWVARMVLMGLYNLGEIPFHNVYIHPKILDGYGETMSKSKGNGVDPLDIIAKFGVDALRFGLAYMSTETQDVRMPVEFECPHCQKLVEQTQKNRTQPRIECTHCHKPFSTQWAAKPEDVALPRAAVVSDRFELGRNFCNKLWNAARFALLNLAAPGSAGGLGPNVAIEKKDLAIEDQWILSRLSTVTMQITEALEQYRFADAARTLYDFAWDEFCSFYLEMAKTRLQDSATRPVAQRILAHALDTIMRLLHPMSPFIAEEVWQRLNAAAPERGLAKPQAAAESVMIAPWPEADESLVNEEIESRFARFQEVLRGIRDVRARYERITRETVVKFSARCDAASISLIEPMRAYFESMASAVLTSTGPNVQPPPLSAHFTASGIDIYVDLAEHIDVEAEKSRKEKETAKYEQLIAAKEKQLSNESFVSRAPATVVAKERAALEELRAAKASADATLAMLRGIKK